MATAPPKPPPPKPPAASSPPTRTTEPTPIRSFSSSCGIAATAHKVVIYGAGGVGKSELCANLRHVGIKAKFVDVEDSTKFLDVERVDPAPESLDELHHVLRDPSTLEGFDALVIDSLTKVEELAVKWTIANVSHEKQGYAIKSIESYGWGKGYVHVYETFMTVLQDLDTISRRGTHVICTAHDCTANVPNPTGQDFIRYEPRLQSPPSGKGSIRHRVLEWCDHLLFVGYDVTITDGKVEGSGTRTIQPVPLPTAMAKSRTLSSTVPYPQGDAELWKQLFNLERES